MNDAQSASLSLPQRAKHSRYWLWLGVLLVVGAAVSAAVVWLRPRPPATPPALPETADHLVRAALDEARSAVLRDPRSGPAWGHLGLTYYANGFLPFAGPIFEEAERLDPSDFRWPYFLGLMKFLKDNNDPEAKPYFERARRLTANEMPAYRIALCHLANKDIAEAERQLKAIVAASPGHGLACLRLGAIAFELDDLDGALDYLHQASELYIARREAYRYLSEIYTKKKQLNWANYYRSHFDKMPVDLQDMDPVMLDASRLKTGLEVFKYRFDSAIYKEDYRAAWEIAEQVVQVYPEYHHGYTHAGQALANLAKKTASLEQKKVYLDQAEAYLNKTKAISLKNATMWLHFGQINYERGLHWGDGTWLRKAIECYDKHLELIPSNEVAIYDKAICLRELGELSQAVSVLRSLVKNRPDLSVAAVTLGECLLQGGNWVESYHFLRRGAWENAPSSEERALALQWLSKL